MVPFVLADMTSQLTYVCTNILTDIPWKSLSDPLHEFIGVLKNNAFTGYELRKLFYYIHSLVMMVNNYTEVHRSFIVTERTSHDTKKDKTLKKLLDDLTRDIFETRSLVITYVVDLTGIINSVSHKDKTPGFFTASYQRFQIDWIKILSRHCEDKLLKSRKIIEDLDKDNKGRLTLIIIIYFRG